MRWALCTDDIYNANPILKNILKAGRTLPIKRTKGMEQPLLKVNETTAAVGLTCGLMRSNTVWSLRQRHFGTQERLHWGGPFHSRSDFVLKCCRREVNAFCAEHYCRQLPTDFYPGLSTAGSELVTSGVIPFPHPMAFRAHPSKDFLQKLEQGEWGHIFAEGAIRQPWRCVFLPYPVRNGCFGATGNPRARVELCGSPGPLLHWCENLLAPAKIL